MLARSLFAKTGYKKLTRLLADFASELLPSSLADTAVAAALDNDPDDDGQAELEEVDVVSRPGNRSEDDEATFGTEFDDEGGEDTSAEGEVLPKALLMIDFICSGVGAAGAAGMTLTRTSESSVFK